MTPITPMARFLLRWLPARLVPVALVLCYAFLLFASALTLGTPPPDVMYIDVRSN